MFSLDFVLPLAPNCKVFRQSAGKPKGNRGVTTTGEVDYSAYLGKRKNFRRFFTLWLFPGLRKPPTSSNKFVSLRVLRLFEMARVLVRLDHVASFIVNANCSIM